MILFKVIEKFVFKGAEFLQAKLQSKLQYSNECIDDMGILSSRAIAAWGKAKNRRDITEQREKREANKIINKLNYFGNLNKRIFIFKLLHLTELENFNYQLHSAIVKHEFDMII